MTDETGSRRLPPGYTTLGGYPGSGDSATMPPPPDDPSGSLPPHDVSDAFTWSQPIHGDLNATYTGTLGRILDPVRGGALMAAAVLWDGRFAVSSEYIVGDVLETAERFAAWLDRDPEQPAEQLPSYPHAFVDEQGPSRLDAAPCLLITGPDRICGHRRDDPVHVTQGGA